MNKLTFAGSLTLSYEELVALEGFEIELKTIGLGDAKGTRDIKVNSSFYIYHTEKVKVRGVRGMFVFIDFFDKKGRSIATLMVSNYDKLMLYDFNSPCFDVVKK